MARGGGSFSGGGGSSSGGHSGGSFGGGHSGGGRSFGGRSSSGSSSRSSRPSGSFHTPSSGSRRTPPPVTGGYVNPSRSTINPGGGNFNNSSGGGFQQRPRKKRDGLITSIIMIAVFVLVLLFIVGLFADDPDGVQNTTARTPLTGAVQMTDYYKDDIGWITEKDVLISGLEDFYHETGVQPYVLFVPYDSRFWRGDDFNSDAGQAYLEQVYSSTFKDEAHFIFAYFACANDGKDILDGHFAYLKGYQADTIMDNEALKIFWGNFEKYYNDTSYTIEEMFANAFSDTATRIMSAPTNGYDAMIMLIIVAGIACVIICIVVLVRTAARRKREKEEYNRKLLETPLETFGTDTSELEKKYQD